MWRAAGAGPAVQRVEKLGISDIQGEKRVAVRAVETEPFVFTGFLMD
jgi:hypothetical protein